MRIGNLRIAIPFTLAPMEEHTNYCFRMLMKRFGAGLVCGERVDAADVAQHDRRAMRLLHTEPAEKPCAGQISGADPAVMAQAARVVEESRFDIVDLNFECPIRRLVDRGEGGALLANPPAIEAIVRAVVQAVSIPVTLKIRSGIHAECETAVEIAHRAEQAGAAAITVHARSVAQGYVGGPDWSIIARVKAAVAMPVLGSGGIRQAVDALRMLQETGADGAAIGRGCLGNPWIFQQARSLLAGGAARALPANFERGRVLLDLVEGEFRLYSPPVALRRLPRVSCYFAQGLANYVEFRSAVQRVENLAQFRRLVRDYFV